MPVLTPIALALMVALPMRAQAQQIARPVAVPLPTTVPVPAASWRVNGSGAAWTAPAPNARGGLDAVVNQDSQRAIYQWQSFDIGSQSSVTFNLPASGGALNRVVGSTAPSQIFGQLRSTVPGAGGSRVTGGELLLINQNGVLFGPSAQVNTGSLIASTLNAADSDFLSGYAQSINGLGASFRNEGDPLLFTDEANYVRVDAGAVISTASGGRVFLFAKNVQNDGTITAPGGQTVLAGGGEVYLNDPGNEKLYASEVNAQIPALRGLLVEVGGANGTVTNGGAIEVPRGNATLVAMAVNQQGRISATTSVTENGSVMLLARAGATGAFDASSNIIKRASVSGQLTLGANSTVEISPDTTLNGAGQVPTSDNNTSFTTSRVELAGQTVSLDANALIHAPGAIVNVRAEDIPDYTPNLARSNSYAATSPTARVLLADGARIDVSGTTDTVVSADRYFVTTELLGANDLKDAPVQRTGPLYRSRVTFDVRRPVPILGDTSAYTRGIKRSVNERLADGGSVSVVSTGGVVTHQNASIDVSGGRITTTAAEVNPSLLIAVDGSRYSLNDAPKDLVYSAIEGKGTNAQDRWGPVTQWTPTRNRTEAGYTEGRNGGTLNLLARDAVLDGAVLGRTEIGERQRAGTDARATSGTLELGRRTSGDFVFGSTGFGTAGLADLEITARRETLDPAFWADPTTTPLPAEGRIAAETLNSSGFGTIRITADGSLEQAAGADLRLPAQTSLQLGASGARGIALQADVRSVGGSLLVQTADASSGESLSGAITVAAGVTLDVAGNWVNRRLDGAQASAAVAGGTVELLSAHGLAVGDRSSIDVSGGATVSTSGAVTGTAAGRIALESNRAVTSDTVALAETRLGAELRGFGMAQGGTLRLRAPAMDIVTGNGVTPITNDPVTGSLTIATDLFSQGGFTSFDLDGGGFLDIVDGVRLAPRAQQWVAGADARSVVSGTRPSDALSSTLLPDALRRPVNVTLAAGGLALDRADATGTLLLGPGAIIDADPGARVTLTANAQLQVDGTVNAPGGQVTLGLAGRGSTEGTLAINGFAGRFEVGPEAVIDVSGRSLITPTDNGLRQGRVLDAGSIALTVSNGPNQGRQTLIDVAEGAVLRADGARDALDVNTLTAAGTLTSREAVAGSAGSIRVSAQEGGARLAGTLQARAADATSAGGSLTIAQPSVPSPVSSGGVEEHRIEVSAGSVADLATQRGVVHVSANGIASGGFADVTLASPQRIHFNGDLTLAAQRNLTVQAAVLSAAPDALVALQAPTSVRLGAGAVDPAAVDPAAVVPVAASGGTAALAVDAAQVVLAGDQTTQALGRIDLRASSLLKLEGVARNGSELQASALRTGAEVHIDAPQTVVATLAAYTLDAAGQTVTFAGGDASSTAQLSAGGSLTVNAARIVQDGVIRAPLGRVTFNATDSVTLTERSITSVAGAGATVPFGSTTAGANLNYLGQSIVALPDKGIQLLAPGQEVEVRAGAVLDMSGGGALVAHEFVPGPGGSTDVFAGAAGGAFAVIPAQREFAPSDAAIAALADASGAVASIPTGRTITFGEGAPLPAGTYAVLPARYALLPGAFLVTPVSTNRVASGYAQTRPDGSALVGASLGSTGTSLATPSTGFVVRTSAQARQFSEVRNTDVDAYLASVADLAGGATPRLAQDAGNLDIAARQLTLAGSNRFTLPVAQLPGQPARGGGIAIAADRIEVNETTGSDAGTLYLAPSQLNATGADSLTLGALRGASSADGRALLVSAREVVLDNRTEALRANDIVLAATEQVRLTPGAQVIANVAGTARADAETLNVQGDGALLRTSSDPAAASVRSGTSRTLGALEIGAGALVQGASVTAEATARTVIDADAQVEARNFTLGAARIAIGEVAPGTVTNDTLVISAGLAERIGRAEQATLRSFDSIEFHGNATLGSDSQRALVLDAGALRTAGGIGTASVKAGEVRLTNSTGAASPEPELGAGQLTIRATGLAGGSGDLTVGPGSQSVAGVATTALQAQRSVLLDGNTAVAVAGDLEIGAVSLTATQAATATLNASGRLLVATAPSSGTVDGRARGGAGASVQLTANQIEQAGTIELESGHLTLEAAGSALPAGGAAVRFASGSVTDLRGASRLFDGKAVDTSGGRIGVSAIAGDIALADGARVDVSAGGPSARGGELSLSAPSGAVLLGGTLLGTSQAGAGQGATLQIDSGTAADPSRLGALLATQSTPELENFSDSLTVRNRTGDQSVLAGTTLTAAEVTLSSDTGTLSVAGTLDASGAQGGQIRLGAGRGVAIESGALLSAHAEAADGDGGQIQLMSTAGRIALNSGARIDTGGLGTGDGGQLLLRAQRLGASGLPVATAEAGSEVAVDPIGASLSGVRGIEVEAAKVYAATAVNTTLVNTVNTHNAAFAGTGGAQVQAIASRLSAGNASIAPGALQVRAGVEVQSAGNLTVTGDTAALGWNLTPFSASGVLARDGANPVNLTLRAAGNLLVQASISDGFRAGGSTAPATAAAARRIVPESTVVGAGASMRLVGGADLGAADILATRRSELAGDVVIGGSPTTDVVVRTTTGDIDIAAGRDVRLTSRQAVVYSTGTPSEVAALPGYTAPGINGALIQSGTFRQAALLEDSGSVSVAAGRDVLGATNGATQYGTDWWWRFTNNGGASWWSRYDKFRQGFGSFGGGDVAVQAGRDAIQVQAAAAGGGYFAAGANAASLAAQRFNDGNVRLTTGRDAVSGFLFGTGEHVDVDVGRSALEDASGNALQIVHGNTDVRAEASLDLTVGRASNAHLLGVTSQWSGSNTTYDQRFGGTATEATLLLRSDAGDVTYSSKRTSVVANARLANDVLSRVIPSAAEFLAPAGDVSLGVDNSVVQAPATASSLRVAARDDVRLAGLSVGGAIPGMAEPTVLSIDQRNTIASDPFAPGRQPLQSGDVQPVRIVSAQGDITLTDGLSVATPLRLLAAGDIRQPSGVAGINLQHLHDTDTSLIQAGGNIVLTGQAVSPSSWAVHGPGDLVVMAGGDIDLQASGGIGAVGNRQNTALPAQSARLTVLAGVSLDDGDYTQARGRYFHLLGGAGIESFAGDLAAQLEASQGGSPLPAVGSAAAQTFAALSADARLDRARALVGDAAYDASLLRWMRGRSHDATLGLDAARSQVAALDDNATAALAARVLGDRWQQQVPVSQQRSTVLAMAQADSGAYAADLAAFVAARTGSAPVDTFDALDRFGMLPIEQQLLHMNRVLGSEIRQAGRTASALGGAERDAAYAKGYDAIATVFPNAARDADLNMGSSQIKSLQGSSIDLLTPRGGINVGELTADTTGKTSSDLGIVTTAGGGISMTVRDDVAVNQSRVFTVGQGDLQIWASEGNIDAGRGAKTVTGAPPPVYRLVEGRIVVDTSSSYAGSGIAVLDASSTLDLYAPKGEINAGDAGIKSAGNAFFGAVRFVGADNLAVGGVAVGAPPPPPAAGGTAGLAATAQSATSAGNRSASTEDEEERRKRRARRNLSLDFLGFGSERN